MEKTITPKDKKTLEYLIQEMNMCASSPLKIRSRWMCYILEDINEGCGVLVRTGLKQLWLTRGYNIDLAWTVPHKLNLNSTLEKIECIRLILWDIRLGAIEIRG